MFQFLHAADLHLDSPLTGLARYEGLPAEEIRNASRQALVRLVECAVERRVRFVILAGDIYDGSWRDAATGLFFAGQMARLRQAGIPVYLIQGNHDAESVMAKSIRLPDNVHAFSGRKAGSVEVPDVPVVVHGQSFVNRATEANLAAQYPARVEGRFNIGVLHTSLSGFEGHAPYAPCSLDDLAAKGYDYWALGHVHNAQILSRNPHVVFPGNLQGRNIRETGPKGAFVVSVDDGLRVEECAFVAMGSFQWQRVEVDLAGCGDVAELHRRFEAGLRAVAEAGGDDSQVIVRVRFTGATALHATLPGQSDWKNDLRALTTDVSSGRMWLEKIELDLVPEGRTVDLTGPMAELTEALQRAAVDPEIAAKADLQPMLQKLPDDIRGEVSGWLDPAGPRYRRLLDEVESMLVLKLTGQGGAE
ncbi:metallophosphoesterase family protein [Paludibaculum fermentans]|uniref:DNA repair exonuclease n=1 Tax=Paludibaculum fermentans TaxID=1473598 RepID=A0A7S7SNJ1_PALFE|nr:DNA repair exonuclease [Paludibaculum fermentans]QOY90621.1 DNA repair exonuclease [Paludibaculum fermentans]